VGLGAEIEQHVLRNPNDWSVLDLFRRLGALRSSDHRFALFLQGLVSGAVTPDEQQQRRMVDAIGPALSHAQLKIVEVGVQDGYPDFTIMSTGAHTRPAQLILFASRNRKPDLRLRDVLDRQIELLDDADDALVYDRPVPESGLTWDHLQTWWADRQHIPFSEARRDLWRRLRASIPTNSPPQQELFDSYHQEFAQNDGLLALLPEVWVHWDPVTKSARQDDALLTQRMDFLMLLPMHRRVVLEVDGAQHYSTANGQSSPVVYAETTRADRGLRLSGYEVYRFSGHELSADRAQTTVSEFFSRLLRTSPTTARSTATEGRTSTA
jgi:very-short-patch-repair endonuclease